MIATIALIRDTFREAFARRIFWGFFGCCTALLLFIMFIMRVDVVAGALATVTIFGRSMPSADLVGLVQQTQSVIAMVLYFAGMALSVFASAGLVSAMFEPGRIELLLSKPVSRVHLLLGRYIGNVLVVTANILYLVAGSWIIFGVKTGVWGAGYLISSLCTIFIFSVLLAVLVLAGVLWDSAAIGIMATFAIMIVTPILAQKDTIERLLDSEWSRNVVRVMYYALPKTSDISVIIRHLILNQPVESWMPVWSTALFGIVVLGAGNLAVPAENVLMRVAALVLLVAICASAEPKIDNVLIRMVPPGTTSIVGARMDVLKATDFYKKMLAAQKLPQLDRFAVESGFDPRRDVKEILFAEAPQGSVLLGRGTFRINEPILNGAKKIRYHEYTIVAQEASGFCILDSTLAVAGEIPAIEAALDEWKSGKHTAAQPLIAKVKAASDSTQLWGVSTGAAAFLADNLPIMAGGIDFSKIFRGLEDTWFVGDFSAGLRADVHGTAAKEQDAANLRDAVKGLVGLGRLSVPEKQPELLKLWDGITVEQAGRAITVHADIPQDLMERVVRLLSASQIRTPPGGKI